jgi:hypothetical protein
VCLCVCVVFMFLYSSSCRLVILLSLSCCGCVFFFFFLTQSPTDLDALLKARDESVNINKTIGALIVNQPFVFDEDLATATILSPAEKENLASRYPELAALLMEPGMCDVALVAVCLPWCV